jgi:hypothetical protein
MTTPRDPFAGLLDLADELEAGTRTTLVARRPTGRPAPPRPSRTTAGLRPGSSIGWLVATSAALLAGLAGLLLADPTRPLRTLDLFGDGVGTSSADEPTGSRSGDVAADGPLCDIPSLEVALGTIDGVAFQIDEFACDGPAAYVRLRPATAEGAAVFAATTVDGSDWAVVSTSWVDDCETRVLVAEPSFPEALCQAID